MSKSPKKSPPKTRRTYTRRSPRTKLHDALDELRDLIDRHCGAAPANAPKTAIAQEKAALATQVPYNAFSNMLGPAQNATLQPTFNATTEFVPQYPTQNEFNAFGTTQTIPTATTTTTTTSNNPFNMFDVEIQQPMMQPLAYDSKIMPQPMMPQPMEPKNVFQKLLEKVTCPGGVSEYNAFVVKYVEEQKALGRADLSVPKARQEIKDKGLYKLKCLRNGTAILVGTNRKGEAGKPVPQELIDQIFAAVPDKVYNNTRTKMTYFRKPATNATKKSKKVKVQAPGNIVPVTPGRTNGNPFNQFNEPKVTKTKRTRTVKPKNTAKPINTRSNFNLLGFNQPKANTTATKQNNFNLFGFNQPTSTIGTINALQPSMKASTNSYEFIGEPEANGTRKIRIKGQDYFLTRNDQRLYPNVNGDFGESVGVFNKNFPGFIREEE